MSIRHNRSSSSSQNIKSSSNFNVRINPITNELDNNITKHTILMEMKNNIKNTQNKQNMPKHTNISSLSLQYQILVEKMKKIEASMSNYQSMNDQLREQNFNLSNINAKQTQIIEKISLQVKQKDIIIKDLHNQVQARKRSSEETIKELRQDLTTTHIKNDKLLNIIKYLQNEVNVLQTKQQTRVATQSGLKLRINQLIDQNQGIRKKMAKAQVQSQKYKLKALQSQKYWNSKIQIVKNKKQQMKQSHQIQKNVRYQEQIAILKAENQRLDKINLIRNKQIESLEARIISFVQQQNKAN